MNSQTTELPELPEAHGWIGANDIDPDAGVEGYTADQMRAYARAALEHAQRVAQPATGWKLVPQQPTPEMIGAMAVTPATMQINGGYTLGMAGAEEAYAAMLAATPSAGEAQTERLIPDYSELLQRIREAAGDPTGKLMQDELVQHIADLRSAGEAEARDARRYRWLRDHVATWEPPGYNGRKHGWYEIEVEWDAPNQLDIAIDETMAEAMASGSAG